MASFLNRDEQGFYDGHGHDSPAGSEFDLDFSTSPVSTMQDFISEEDQLATPPQNPDGESSAMQGEAGTLLILPVPLGPRNTFFFLDHTRRLAVTHYQTEPKYTTPTAATAPRFLLKFYIRSNASMFNTRDKLKTILGWCEQLLVLPAINHLLHELGLSGTSIRFEMYDGLESFEAIIAHSRSEREHRHMHIEYLDCEREVRLAQINVQHGNHSLHPTAHPRIRGRLQRAHQLQKSITDYEARNRHPNAWTRPANILTPEQAAALVSRVDPELLISSRGSPQGRPRSASTPLLATSGPGLAHPISSRIAKPGSPLNPLAHSADPIIPASFLAPGQAYHHAVVVIDEYSWHKRGLVVLKFDKERDWSKHDDVGSLDEGSYVAERVSCLQDGRVEQRASERNAPEWTRQVRIGELGLEQEMEIVSKRWLGEVLVEIIKGGYFAHLGM